MVPVNAQLVGVAGIVAGRTFSVGTSPLTIGRSPDVEISVPSDASVSRNHAQVYANDGLVYLIDLGSSNRTLLNGQVITGPTALKLGDVISCGAQTFLFSGEVPPFPVDSQRNYQDAQPQVPGFATGIQNQSGTKPLPSNNRKASFIAVPVMFVLVFIVVYTIFSVSQGLFSGGSSSKNRELRQSIRTGMSIEEVRELAGEPESKSVDDGPLGHTEMWTYNGLGVFVHFNSGGRVEMVNSFE